MIDLVYLVGTRLPRAAALVYPDLLWRIPTQARQVYFTFDDGPTVPGTGRLLDVLARHAAPATFFLLGAHAAQDPGLVRALVDAGHTVGNHTYTHPNAWRTPTHLVLGELDRTTGLLEDLTGQPLRWMRPPYGYFTRPMRSWCQLRRQRLTMWDLGTGDFLRGATQAQVEQRILRGIRPGTIIVLHDNPNTTVIAPNALANVLAQLHAEDWHFAAL